MKVFKAWRFKCDHCGKNARQRKAMERHEQGCTANPDRVCRMHEHATGETKYPTVAESWLVLSTHCRDADHGLEALREFTGNCPACMLAAIRKSGMCKSIADEDGFSDPLIGTKEFNFKEEVARVWNEKQWANAQREYY